MATPMMFGGLLGNESPLFASKPQVAAVPDLGDADWMTAPTRAKAAEVDTLSAKLPQAQADVAKAKADVEADVLRRKAEVTKDYARNVQGLQEQADRDTWAEPAFNPTKNQPMEIGKIFSLIATMGVMSGGAGKMGAMQAMNAMTGMLKGYQAGDQEAYERAKVEYDEGMKTIQSHNALILKHLENAMSLAATDREAANIEQEMAARNAGSSSIITAQLNQGKIEEAIKTAQASLNMLQKTDEMVYSRKLAADQAKELAKMRSSISSATHVPYTLTGKDGSQTFANYNKSTGQYTDYDGNLLNPNDYASFTPIGSKVAATGGVGSVQFRYNQGVVSAGNAGLQELNNVVSLPSAASAPALGAWVASPTTGLSDALTKGLSQKMTGTEARLFQQEVSGLVRQIGVIYAAGRPGGSAQSAIEELNKMAPQGGDKKINIYAFLAMARQAIELSVKDLKTSGATKEQIAQAQENADAARDIVKFTVADINKVARAGGSQLVDPKLKSILGFRTSAPSAATTAPAASGTPASTKQYKTEKEAKDAVNRGEIQDGDTVSIGGVAHTWKKN
jgi:hypothetical protein